MRKGQSTHGYGQTKRICLEGQKLNMSIPELAEKWGMTENAIRSCSIRNKIKLRNITGRKGWGVVKEACLEGIEKGWTLKEVAERHGLKLTSVRRTANAYKMNFNETKKD